MNATWEFFVASGYWPWFWGLIGLIIGSFLNVVILRLPKRLEWEWGMECHVFQGGNEKDYRKENPPPPDLVFAQSRCPNCGRNIKPWENVPVFGWLGLRGKCAGCKQAISAQYPLVEATTGILFFVAASLTRDPMTLLPIMAFLAMSIAIAVIDAKTMIIPDKIVLPMMWLGLLASAFGSGATPELSQSVIGAACGYLSLWSIYWAFKLATGKEGMGYGDFKLMAAIGAWMGPIALPWVMVAAAFSGVAFGVYGMIRKGGERKPIPFGPFLVAGSFLVWILAQTGTLSLTL